MKNESNTSSQGIDTLESIPILETNSEVDSVKVPKGLTAKKEVVDEDQNLENIREPESEVNQVSYPSALDQTNARAIQRPNEQEDKEHASDGLTEKIKVLTVTADITK